MKMLKKKRNVFLLLALLALFFPMVASAQGLDAASSALDEFRVWAYGFLAIVVLVYILYKVMMAFLEKQSWGDVAVGLGYVALAGGIIVAAEFMWAIWGS